MIYIISIVISVVVFFVVGVSLDGAGDGVSITLAAIAAVIAFKVSVYKMKTRKSASTIALDTLGSIKEVKGSIESNIDSKQAEYFYLAEQEYDGGNINNGLWSQALVKAKGDENLRKVEYMKLRVKQLIKYKNA